MGGGQKRFGLVTERGQKGGDSTKSGKKLESIDNIIVDSNSLFSAILNLNRRIGQIVINGQEYLKEKTRLNQYLTFTRNDGKFDHI